MPSPWQIVTTPRPRGREPPTARGWRRSHTSVQAGHARPSTHGASMRARRSRTVIALAPRRLLAGRLLLAGCGGRRTVPSSGGGPASQSQAAAPAPARRRADSQHGWRRAAASRRTAAAPAPAPERARVVPIGPRRGLPRRDHGARRRTWRGRRQGRGTRHRRRRPGVRARRRPPNRAARGDSRRR